MTTNERRTQVYAEKIAEATNAEQINDATNHPYSAQEVINLPLTITSVSPRTSDEYGTTYALIGFHTRKLGRGQFTLSGPSGDYALKFDRFPRKLILRPYTLNGNPSYRWEKSK